MTGPIVEKLFASTSARDTDWTAKLVDVGPDGFARNVQDGIVRARYREAAGKAGSLLEPGRVYEYSIDMWATSNVFLPGHRIRLEISSSNFPRFDRNLNTGEDPSTGTRMEVAKQTVYHSAHTRRTWSCRSFRGPRRPRAELKGLVVAYRMSLAAVAAGLVAATWTGVSAQRPAVPNLAGKVLTVAGPIEPSALGPTLMHEHIFIDFKRPASAIPAAAGAGAAQRGPMPPGWNLLADFNDQLAEVSEFKKAGGGTIVDVTNLGLSRDPRALLRISQASGLHVVMGAGWYQKALHAPDMTDRTVDELTDLVVRDVATGAQGTNIRSGIIGEVGVEGNPLTDNELKSVRASARASRITGAPMTFHRGGATVEEKLRVLDVVAEEGVDLKRVVMGHQGSTDFAALKRLLDRGVYVEFDYIGQAPLSAERDQQLIQNIVNVINAGYAGQLMVAHDICTQPQLKKNGGGGFAYISTVVLPGLKAKGISDENIRKILVDNPMRLLPFAAPRP